LQKILGYSLLLLLLIGCIVTGTVGAETQSENYFPLQVGNKWLFRVNAADTEFQMEYNAVSKETVDGQETIKVESVVNGLTSQTEYYEVTTQGIFTILRNLTVYEFHFNPKQIFLKYPVTIGQSWNQKGNFSDPAQKVSFQYEQQCQYIAMEEVSVPAGTFKAVKLRITLTVTDGSYVEGYRYFSPNVGLIKEDLNLTLANNKIKVQSELLRFEPGSSKNRPQ